MSEIASGSEPAVGELMEVSTEFLPQGWLVFRKLLYSVGEEAVVSIRAVALFRESSAKLDLPFL
jgi:hypothetical protein